VMVMVVKSKIRRVPMRLCQQKATRPCTVKKKVKNKIKNKRIKKKLKNKLNKIQILSKFVFFGGWVMVVVVKSKIKRVPMSLCQQKATRPCTIKKKLKTKLEIKELKRN